MPDQVFVSQPPTPPLTSPAVVTPPPAKKNFPKKIILALVGILLLIIIVVIISKFLGKKETKSGVITWWGLWEEESTISPLIAEYKQKNPKIEIKYLKQSPQDYRERLTNALAKGTGPDIFAFHNSWVPMFKNDLSPLPASVMTTADYAKSFYSVITADLTADSGIVGIPLGYDALTLFINEDIFAAAGKNPPATWDDLRNLAIELTKKDEQGTIIQAGVALGRTENVDHWPEILGLMMLQNGVDLTNPTGKLAEDALTFFTLFSSVDGVWDATLPASTAAFAGSKLAMYFGPSWRVFQILEQNPSLKFKAVPLPQLPKSGPGQKAVSYATYWASGAWNRSKNKDLAWDFLKFVTSSESLAKIYTNASRQRLFGQPYPRMEMAGLLNNHPLVGSVITGAPDAQSWFLQSRTFDGPTGINSLINKYFEDALNAVNTGTPADKALPTTAQGVSQILSRYGIVK